MKCLYYKILIYRENLNTYAYGKSQEQLEENEDNEDNKNNNVIVNHVKQLLNEVIDAVVSDNHSENNENQSIQSQTMNTNNNNNQVGASAPTVQISSTYKNNTHLIITENGETTTFILRTADDDPFSAPPLHQNSIGKT